MLTRNVKIEGRPRTSLSLHRESGWRVRFCCWPTMARTNSPKRSFAKISQETLAELAGTRRSHVDSFMDRFRKHGYINYNGGLQVPF